MMNFEINGHGRTIVMSLITIFFAGVAILWSWNTIAMELFAQPEMEFRHAMAVELLLIAVGSLVGLPGFFAKFRDA